MTNPEKMRYIRASILAAVGAAGIGAAIRGRKARKDREKSLDFASSSNAIVVPVSKKKFLDGLKTPDEQRAEYEGKKAPASGDRLLGGPSGDASADIEPADLAAVKKDILRQRRFDFFPKKAEGAKTEANAGEASGVASEEKTDGRVVLRGQDGRFASQEEDCILQDECDAVSEKTAGILSDFKAGLTGHPVAMTAGAVGSVMLAAKISDMINERRREKAKDRLEDARARYVALLEDGDGNEKTAGDSSDSLSGLGGKLVGTAFLVPLALTAMVTNRIIENRKAEKKRRGEMSDSFPADPTILYRTYDGDTLKVAADTALMAIMVKRAMIDDAERAEAFEKSAQLMPGQTRDSGTMIAPEKTNMSDEVKFAVRNMTDPKNRKDLLRFIKAMQDEDEREMESAYRAMMPFGTVLGNHYDVARTPEFKRELASSQALQDAIVGNLETDGEWKKYRDARIADRLAGMGLDKGGILHKIIMWLATNLGFGNSMAKKYIASGFDSARDKYQKQIDQAAADQAAADKAKAEADMRRHFAPLENFKGTEQERQALENRLTDSWMAREVEGISTPESFEEAARQIGQLSPGSPQYKTLYDALSKKKSLNPSAFDSLEPPQAAPSAPAQQARNQGPTYGGFGYLPEGMQSAIESSMNGENGQAQAPAAAAPASAPATQASRAEPYQGDQKRLQPRPEGLDAQQYEGQEAPDYAVPDRGTWAQQFDRAMEADKARLANGNGQTGASQTQVRFTGSAPRTPNPNDASWRMFSRLQQNDPNLRRLAMNETFNSQGGTQAPSPAAPSTLGGQFEQAMAADRAKAQREARDASYEAAANADRLRLSRANEMDRLMNMSDEDTQKAIDDAIRNP